MNELFEAAYPPLLALNAVALIVVYVVTYVGPHRWAKWLLLVFLALNTPFVLFLLLAVAREARAARGHQGSEGGMALGITTAISVPLMLEFLLVFSAWLRLRAQTQGQVQRS